MRRTLLTIAVSLSLWIPGAVRAELPPVVTLLQELIRADTSNPPGNESRAADVLEKWFRNTPNVLVERYDSAPGRSNLIVTLPGRGDKDPLILLGHLDVVAADPEEWAVPPFKAIIRDDYLWGRGAIDMKGMIAIESIALMQLAETNKAPAGDLILVAVADEEAGGAMGLEWLLKKRPDLLKAGAVLNEGSIGVRRPEFDIFPIQVAEKGVCWMKATSLGTSGHGSMPDPDNAVLKLARAMETLGGYEFPLESSSVTRAFLKAVGSRLPFPEGFIVQNLFTPVIGALLRPIAVHKIAEDKTIHALLSNTATPTRLEAGSKVNVIPSKATGYIDARILPGMTPEKFLNFAQGLIGDDAHLEIVTSSMPNESPLDTEVYRTLVETLKKKYPKAVITPMLSAGATDSRFFRDKGIPAYGLIPVLISQDDLSGLHGHNERIPVESLNEGVTLLKEVIQGVL